MGKLQANGKGLSPELEEEFKLDYQNPEMTMQLLEQKYGKPMGTLWRWAYQCGIKRPIKTTKGKLISVDVTKDDLYRACLEAVSQIKPWTLPTPTPPAYSTGERMEMVLGFADAHFGRQTQSYNPEVAAQRLSRLKDAIIRDVQMLRRRYDIRKLHLANVGDLVTGERIGFQMKLEDLAAVVLNQMFDIAIPLCSQFVIELLTEFNEIVVSGVPGNHGKQDRFSSESFNLDTITYLGWRNWMRSNERVTFNIEPRLWYQYLDIFDWVWLVVHGDQFPARGGFSSKAVLDKCTKWQISMPRVFTNVLMGHFHSRHLTTTSRLRIDTVPTLISHDNWSVEVLGLEACCGQTLFGVTEEGIKYERTIMLGEEG